MSLAETRELMVTMRELISLLGNVQTKTEQINMDMPRTRGALRTFRQLERITLRFLVLAQRMGLPEDVSRALTKVMSLITAIQMLIFSVNMMMSTNPLTSVLGIAGFAGSMMSMGSVVEGY